jgi:hypothetical protein
VKNDNPELLRPDNLVGMPDGPRNSRAGMSGNTLVATIEKVLLVLAAETTHLQ